MGEPERVTRLPHLPKSVTITDSPDIRFSSNEIRRLKAQTGRTMSELMGADADDADRLQGMVWLALHRQGFTEATWEDAGEVEIRFEVEVPDPTSGES